MQDDSADRAHRPNQGPQRGPGRGRPRWGTLALVILLHVAIVAGLARAFAPDLTASAVDRALSVLTVTVTAPEEAPTPEPQPEPEPDEGAAGEEGARATPRPTSVPEVRLPVRPKVPAPRASSTGTENHSGAAQSGAGTGGADAGGGTGRGNEGAGQASGIRALAKIAGEINSARDYPRETRDLRIGHSVTILLTVGTDGLVKDCRVTDPSPDPQADRITCQLAAERFRFRPAADARGNAIVGRYAWRQRWFY